MDMIITNHLTKSDEKLKTKLLLNRETKTQFNN